MRTSLNEIHLIESYLLGNMPAEDSGKFEKRLESDKALGFNTLFQRRVYKLIERYHRKKLKEEAAIIHRRLFDDPANQHFRESIHKLFNTYQ